MHIVTGHEIKRDHQIVFECPVTVILELIKLVNTVENFLRLNLFEIVSIGTSNWVKFGIIFRLAFVVGQYFLVRNSTFGTLEPHEKLVIARIKLILPRY